MAKDPAFPFYASDYIVKSMRWTDEMKALYTDLRAESWLNGSLADVSGAPKGLTPQQRETFGLIKHEFSLTDEGWVNNDLEEAREVRRLFKERQKNNGSKGGRPAKEKKPDENQPNPIGFENNTHGIPETNPDESQPITQIETQDITQKKPLENEKENEKEIDSEVIGNENLRTENKVLLPVPAMKLIWKAQFPKYIFRAGVDEQPLRIIAEILGEANNVSPFDYAGVKVISEAWQPIVEFIGSDTLFKTYQLTQVEKYLQAITSKMESKADVKLKTPEKKSIIKTNINAASGAHQLIKKKYGQQNES